MLTSKLAYHAPGKTQLHAAVAARSWHRWNLLVGCGLLVSAVAVIGFNYCVDPYEIFHSGIFKPAFAVNERYNKVEYLLANKDKYDSFIVGSSVMGAFDPRVAQDLHPGHRYYNFSFLGGLPSEALANLKAIKREGVAVKEIVMGIDVFPFKQVATSGGFSQKPHPIVSGQSRMGFLSSYLFASSAWQGATKIWHHQQPQPSLVFDIDGTGMYLLKEYDREIAQDEAAYIKKRVRKKESETTTNASVMWVDSRFDEFRELVEWTRQEGIRTYFFIQPFHHLVRDYLPDGVMKEFKDRVTAIVGAPIPDFSQRNDITEVDHNYYDLKHYRIPVANKIMQELFRGDIK
jgi:hypothetical protein